LRVHFKLFILFLLLVSPCGVVAQILDDSTKNVYGPSTTRYALENDVFNNREILYTVDTLLDGFQNFSFLQRNGNLYQDLGNLGTPMRPVFFSPSRQIGAQLGMDVFTPYAFDPGKIKYYNTRSPYTSLYYVQGGNSIQLLDVEHSRNINSRWNVGFRYQRPTAPKQFAAANLNPSQNRQIDSHEFALYSWYKNIDSTYQILANITVMDHRALELGSIAPVNNTNQRIDIQSLFDEGNQDSLQRFFNVTTQTAVLTNAGSRDSRNQIHFYQQYAPVAAFQFYHVFDRQQRLNYYRDTDVTTSLQYNFYPKEPLFTPTTEQETKYLLYENKIGIKGTFTKGRLNGFNYCFHARRRDYSLTSNFVLNNTKRGETFVGGWLNYYFPDSSKFFVEAEYMPGGTNDYRLRAEYQSKLLTGGVYRINQSPTLIQQNFLSNHYDWNHTELSTAAFSNFSSDNIYGQLNVGLGGLLVQPSIHISNLDDYIYFDTQARPQQEENSFRIVRMGLGLQYRLGNFQTVNQAYYTTTTNPGVMRIPALFANSRIAYNILFKKVLYIQVGVDLHYKSAYKADAYMPLSQQFHLQDKLELPPYLLADAFATFRVQRVRLFFKMSHVNEGLMRQPGYLAAPVFTGLPRAFAFGVSWLLFD